jgi:hypothetical protein
MKIYGSLFLWIPLTVFLIWLGIKELPDECVNGIYNLLLILFGMWNFFWLVAFFSEIDIRTYLKELILEKKFELLSIIIFCPIYIIPILTYYLNNKLTIKI